MLAVNKIYPIDALEGLKQLSAESIDCIVTSPPYWALRNYDTEKIIWGGDKSCTHHFSIRTKARDFKFSGGSGVVGSNNNKAIYTGDLTGEFCAKCGAWKGELGAEPDYELYIEHLLLIFNEAKRVLKSSGTLWVNINDTYGGSSCGWGNKNLPGKYQTASKKPVAAKVFPKSMLGIPQRFCIAMVDNGWLLRNVIIWWKPNATPESVKDRFTNDFEYLLFFTKNKKYFFNQQFEDFASNEYDIERMRNGRKEYEGKYKKHGHRQELKIRHQNRAFIAGNMQGRNKRVVWEITTKPFHDAHFAVFPKELITVPISAGCPEKGIVLDPFMGSGTTAMAAKELNRNFIGFELNPGYVEMANHRLAEIPLSGTKSTDTFRQQMIKTTLKLLQL